MVGGRGHKLLVHIINFWTSGGRLMPKTALNTLYSVVTVLMKDKNSFAYVC